MSSGTNSRNRTGLTLLLALAAVAAASSSQAADAGLRVVKDPVTGALRAPTADELKAMEALEAKAAESAAPAAAPVPLRAANGAVGFRVGDQFLTYSVATRKADGTLNIHCVTGEKAAVKLLSAPQSTSSKSAKEVDHAAHQ